jgi:TonB family protein
VNRDIDEYDEEFECLLRQFRPPQPPALKTPLMMPLRMVVAAGIVGASAASMWWLWRVPPATAPPAPPAATQSDALRAEIRSHRASGRSVVRVGVDIEKPPIKIFHVDPVIPDDARAAEVGGVVIVDIVIADDGSVRDARVVKSVPGLDEAAIDAVSQWQFMPTVLDGEPVEVEMNVVVNFIVP